MKEKCHEIERELKILGPVDQDSVVGLLKECARPEWHLVQTNPEVIFDVYFDTPSYDLRNNELQLRFRRRKRALGWTASFKAADTSEHSFVERDKIQTRVKYNELLRYRGGLIPGKAATKAYSMLDEFGAERTLVPNVQVTSFRNRYKLMHPDFIWGDDAAGRQVVFLGFETVFATDVRAVCPEKLVEHGWFDSALSGKTIAFNNTECEARGDGIGMQGESLAVMVDFGHRAAAAGLNVTRMGKYEHVLKQLSLHG